jgi:RES domain-containing protein
MMVLWRIAAETRKYPADDLSGGAAASHPGRWNEEKEPVLYTAPTIAIAVLETAAHIVDAGLPLNRFLIRLDVPEDVWAAREELSLSSLPPTWAAIPSGHASARIGSSWLSLNKTPILMVPSVIVPEEQTALINPRHPMAAGIKAFVHRPFEYNKLFRAN